MAAPASGRAPARSAGILLHRRSATGGLEVLLVHPGGPYWASRDLGAWSIPKGEHDAGQDPLSAARREFREELGTPVPQGPTLDLGEIRQRSGKLVRAFAIEGDVDPEAIISNTCQIEWPPRSGRQLTIPEVDRAQWFDLAQARQKVNPAQAALIDRLLERV